MSVSHSLERVCAHCGSTFYVKFPSRTTRYCGHSCSSKDRTYQRRPIEDRFWEKVNKDGPIPEHRPDLGPCWVWMDAPMPNGYGRIFVSKTPTRIETYAHRLSYQLLVGPIPDGLTIDHLCRNRMCVNPDHLEPVTHQVNFFRGMHPSSIVSRSDFCSKGHERTEANVYVTPAGYKQCRVCNRQHASRRYDKFRKEFRDGA